MKVKKLTIGAIEAIDIPQLFDQQDIAYHAISTVNWKEYLYCPDVKFRMAHTHDAILLHFKVTEEAVRAHGGKDNDPVYEDSCVEFFCIPGGDDFYYNIECNCIGKILIGAGQQRANRLRGNQDVTSLVKRWASLGYESFETRVGETTWEVALVIPYQAFFLHQIKSLDGKSIPANFYKCGDKLPTKHYLSWVPVDPNKITFHCPQFFQEIEFE